MSRSGAKRPLHLVRTMPELGWKPVVLAAPSGNDATDPQLCEAVPDDILVFREYANRWRKKKALVPVKSKVTRTKKTNGDGPLRRVWRATKKALKLNSYIAPFDRYLWDVPSAVRAAKKLIDEHNIELIYACGDPFTVFHTGVKLKKLTGLPLVVDLRDPFALHDGKMALRPWMTAKAVYALEKRFFKAADKVILNTDACLQRYLEHYQGRIPEQRFTAIRNSFDPSLFLDVPEEPFDRFTILYFGTLRRFVALDEFLAGFQVFVERTGLGHDKIQIVVMGELDAHSVETAARFGLENYLVGRPPVSLRESMKYLRAAHLLLLVIQPSCTLQIPGKLYDYFASGTPIFAVSSNEEANTMIRDSGVGVAITGQEAGGVADALQEAYTLASDGAFEAGSADLFTAQEAARRRAAVFNEVSPRERK